MALTEQNNKDRPPPIIRFMLGFFLAVTWAGLIGCTIGAILTPEGSYLYFVPVSIYALFLAVFPLFSYEKGRGLVYTGVWWSSQQETGLKRPLFFILAEFGLFLWMSLYNTSYISMFFALIGHTIGMLPWRIGLLLVGFQVITLTLQAGIFNDTVQDKSSIFWFFFGIVFALLYVVIIVALVRSREKSERLVQELKAAQEQLKTAAIREKEVAILRERDRMAREMHDILGHALVLVAVKIEAAQRLQAVNPERAVAELEATKELVRQSMADLRASLAELRNPTLLDRNKSLALALQEWCGQVSREGKLEVDCRLPTALDTLQSNIQEVIWRVGREVLLNVLKHARARQAELRINIEDKRVILSAWDDGIGISQLASGGKPPEIEGHYGIRGMRERVMAVGGDISFKPNPGSGLLIEVTIPLDIFPANQKAGTPEKDWKVPAPERS